MFGTKVELLADSAMTFNLRPDGFKVFLLTPKFPKDRRMKNPFGIAQVERPLGTK